MRGYTIRAAVGDSLVFHGEQLTGILASRLAHRQQGVIVRRLRDEFPVPARLREYRSAVHGHAIRILRAF